MSWRKVDKCLVCGRIGESREICKCGTVLRVRNHLLALFTDYYMEATDNCEVVIAKKKWFKWIEKEVSQ